jgi:hypothetical protein
MQQPFVPQPVPLYNINYTEFNALSDEKEKKDYLGNILYSLVFNIHEE